MEIPEDKWKNIKKILNFHVGQTPQDADDYCEEKGHYIFEYGEKEGKRQLAQEILDIIEQ